MGQRGSIPMVCFFLAFQKVGGFLLGVVISFPQASDTDRFEASSLAGNVKMLRFF